MRVDLIPKNRFGDRIIAWQKFVRRHKRFPSRNRMLFSDVLYRLKTSDAIFDPLRVYVSDKEYVKDYARAVIGDAYNVPTIAILRTPQDIASYDFPDDCCIKPTHSCGQVIIRRNGEDVDRAKIAAWLLLNQYLNGREANYLHLKPKIIVEELIFGRDDVEDYKFFCWNGMPKIVQVDTGRRADHRRTLLDMTWTDLGYSLKFPKADRLPDCPANFSEMKEIAAKLSQGFDGLIRVDLYSDGKNVLLGELTNISGNAQARFIPPHAEVAASQVLFGADELPASDVQSN